MTKQQIELIGGPEDGRILDVPLDMVILKCAVPVTDWHPALDAPYYRYGHYRPITDDDRNIGRWTWREPQ